MLIQALLYPGSDLVVIQMTQLLPLIDRCCEQPTAAEVDRRITQSNARYEKEILPELQRRDEQRQAQVNE